MRLELKKLTSYLWMTSILYFCIVLVPLAYLSATERRADYHLYSIKKYGCYGKGLAICLVIIVQVA